MAGYNNIVLDDLYEFNFLYSIHDIINRTELYNIIREYPKTYWVNSHFKRLDILSYEIYDSVDKWLILAVYNEIIDPFIIPERIFFIPKNDLIQMLT